MRHSTNSSRSSRAIGPSFKASNPGARYDPSAIPNSAGDIDARALSTTQALALLLRAKGMSYKRIAYELGLAVGVLVRVIRGAMSRLGVARDTDLPLFFRTREDAEILLRLPFPSVAHRPGWAVRDEATPSPTGTFRVSSRGVSKKLSARCSPGGPTRRLPRQEVRRVAPLPTNSPRHSASSVSARESKLPDCSNDR